MKHLRQAIHSLLTRREGSIVTEAALVFPLFLIAILGVIEVSHFIQARERLNKVANQITKVLSTPSTQEEITQVLAIARNMAAPEDPGINVMICSYDLGGGLEFTYQASSGGSGACGHGNRGGGLQQAASCPPAPSASNPGFASTVNVTSSCNYYPLFDAVSIFGGLQIIASTSMPMQGAPQSTLAP